jgi:hypothetical protein
MLVAWTELPFPEGLGLNHTKSAFFDRRSIALSRRFCKQQIVRQLFVVPILQVHAQHIAYVLLEQGKAYAALPHT